MLSSFDLLENSRTKAKFNNLLTLRLIWCSIFWAVDVADIGVAVGLLGGGVLRIFLYSFLWKISKSSASPQLSANVHSGRPNIRRESQVL